MSTRLLDVGDVEAVGEPFKGTLGEHPVELGQGRFSLGLLILLSARSIPTRVGNTFHRSSE